MSQFDLPRISFHGKAFLDTPTANNGYVPAIVIFDQDNSMVFMPPRLYLPPGKSAADFALSPGEVMYDNARQQNYLLIKPINDGNFQQWATTPLGSFAADQAYWSLYTKLQITGMNPGYWNYYGDISMTLQDVLVTGITVLDDNGNPITFNQQNIGQCPPTIALLLGAELSFSNDYFTPGSRTSAYLCDVDSEGQLCTQIFCSKAGLYKTIEGTNVTFFSGRPVKSTARFMNLSSVLNYAYQVPMGGSASFYSKVTFDEGNELAGMLAPFAGSSVNAFFLKILIHEVYEVRSPDYSKMPVTSFASGSGNEISVPKNPACVSITGSITPWFDGDMTTHSISRILKNDANAQVNLNLSGIDDPVPIGSNSPLPMPSSVNLAPVPFVVNQSMGLISLDLSNMLTEYGSTAGTMPGYAGNGDIAPYEEFANYNFGDLNLLYQPDSGGNPINVGTISFDNNYNWYQFICTAGMVDVTVPTGNSYGQGSFSITMGQQTVLKERQIFITTDQQGVYAEQNQVPVGYYMSDGLPKVPCTLRVFNRGIPVSNLQPVTITMQAINMITASVISSAQIQVYDGYQCVFPVGNDGCITYGFLTAPQEAFPTNPQDPNFIWQLAYFAMNTSLIVCRVLSLEPQLAPYLNGQLPVTWEVLYSNVLQLYKTIYPIMDAELPIDEGTWSDPFIKAKIKQLTSEKNWNQPLYMPLTRDMSAAQRQLLYLWLQQSTQQ